jgi:hypothetical protein
VVVKQYKEVRQCKTVMVKQCKVVMRQCKVAKEWKNRWIKG